MRPVLSCIGNPERIIYIGGSPAPDSLQDLQSIASGALSGVSEAFRARTKTGIERGARAAGLFSALRGGQVLEVHGETDADRQLCAASARVCIRRTSASPAKFASTNAVAMPSTAVLTQLVNALVAGGGADLDYSPSRSELVLFGISGLVIARKSRKHEEHEELKRFSDG